MTLTSTERALEIFVVIHLGLMGLSYVLRHRAWAEFFIRLRGRGYAGVFVHGFLNLSFGAVIVALHRVWSGLPMLVSVLGVLYLVKAFQCFVLPGSSLRSLDRLSLERSYLCVGAGVGFLLVAGVTVMSLLRGS
jgi:hypothetical protein